ncbi:sulfotransferase [Fulvivirga ligni]|uniref:sulfotransferase n=1 Tax=Fulvivirga ligni TaxID=2904246 RepID=UPI001F2A27B5|nr:sulfotransferase [Fulvivirga ligni]UII21820.1 sulfotransferase [Fulvivirga ligni]
MIDSPNFQSVIAGEPSNRVLFVSGMHRSGTSLVSQWLNQNNLFMGDMLLSGYSDNKYGHFEDLDFLRLSSNELTKMGLHSTGLILEGDKFKFNHYKIELSRLINERNHNHEIWGWKEPRFTLFMNDIKEHYIPNLKVVAVFRNPIEVIESLYKRLRKNKWYYTRNPIKRLAWYIDIDLNRNKWISTFQKTYIEYNKSIIDFQYKNPKDIIITEVNDFIGNENELVRWLKDNIGLEIKATIKEIYDEDILHKTSDENKNKVLKEAFDIYKQLKSLSI